MLLTDTDLRKDGFVSDLHLFITINNLHHRCSGREVVNKAMIKNVVVKTVDAIEGKYDVFADGVQIADKISMVTFFMEVGKLPHMLIAADFMNLEIDGVKAEVTYSEPLPERKNVDDEIQHVAYDDAQLGREK